MPVYFQTAPDLPTDMVCRTFQIPSSPAWLGIFNALRPVLLSKYNWEQVLETDLTVEESIAIVEAMFTEYWETEVCCEEDACVMPNGSRVIRLSPTGHFEQLANGAWIPPTDEYAQPPTPARTEPTAYERRCLAAANAESVLAQAYEVLSDQINAGVEQAEALNAMLALIGTVVGVFVVFPAVAIIALTAAIVQVAIEVVEYITADLWDEAFSDQLRCILFECSTDTDDVVTFDWTCINEILGTTVDLLSPVAYLQLQLYGQVRWMLSWIGADGLNAAGATTGVTSANCDGCLEWCYEWNFADGEGDWQPIISSTGNPLAVYSDGSWKRVYNNGGLGYSETRIYRVMDVPTFVINTVEVWFATGTEVEYNAFWGEPTTLFIHEMVDGDGCKRNEVAQSVPDLLRIDMGVLANTDINIYKIRITGGGVNPFGADNCGDDECEEP